MKKKWFIGIDVSKKTLDVVVYDPAKKKADNDSHLLISNDEEGYKSLLKWFKDKKISLPFIVICMEYTGI